MISDRLCAIELTTTQQETSDKSILTIISVYLPSSNHPVSEFSEYLSELINAFNALKSNGPILLVGDFNAHLSNEIGNSSSSRNQQSTLLSDFLQQNDLFVASTCCLATGPKYTFYSNTYKTTVDYILADSSLANNLVSCFVHINLSDHLPISVSLNLNTVMVSTSPKSATVNWQKAIENRDTCNCQCS